MSNDIHVYSSSEGLKDFINSSIATSKTVLEHYDFVINDISSDISDARLEATKSPALTFLKEMRGKWIEFKTDLEDKLRSLEEQ